MRAALAEPDAAGIVVARTCDQMRRIFEILSSRSRVPCLLFDLPATWQSTQARRQYAGELERLGRFLQGLGGRPPSRHDLGEALFQPHAASGPGTDAIGGPFIPLALAGAHPMAEDGLWMGLFEKQAGRIVADLTLPDAPRFDRRSAGAPFEELADACFDAIEEIFQRPNSRFYRRLDRELRRVPVKGLVVRRYLWCDLWRAEIERLRQWAPLPVLDLEISGRVESDRHRLSTRIQSFMEMVA
jgi:benzoyl-CoA reductase/2-hydroxyglutaryl-CoA dehydratase subunit BcrC/BadD/HgdB